MKKNANMQNETNVKTRLSIEEFLSMNEQWLERSANLKRKSTRRIIVLAIGVIVVFAIPFVITPVLMDIFYLEYMATMLVSAAVSLAAYIAVVIAGVSSEHRDEAESEKLKKELYSQYLKKNGFL